MVGFHLSTLKRVLKFPGCAQFTVYNPLEIQADGPTPKLSLGPSNSTNPRVFASFTVFSTSSTSKPGFCLELHFVDSHLSAHWMRFNRNLIVAYQ
jgi:hypothetical protein